MFKTEYKVTWRTTRDWERGHVYSSTFNNLEMAMKFKQDEENIKENYNVKLLSRVVSDFKEI